MAAFNTLNAGIVGLGFIGQQHLDAIRRVPGARLCALCEPDAAVLDALGERHGISKRYSDWRDMLNDPDIQVIHNCTPNALHDGINREALRRGKHVYCEKPLSNSAAQAREMLALARGNRLAHGLNHQYRLNAAVQEMRARLQSGLCGRPLFVEGWYQQESAVRQTDWSYRMENTGPARALNDIGIHWMDTASAVLGQPVKEVMAELFVHHPVRTDAQGQPHAVDTEDTGLILLRFMDGTPGSLVVSKSAAGHKNDLRLHVACDQAGMEWRQEEPDKLEVNYPGNRRDTIFMSAALCQPEAKRYVTTPMGHVMGWTDALRNAVGVYYESILSGSYLREPQPYSTFADGFYGMAFVEACLRSARERRWVEVEAL